jgi:hypothetical protein
LRGSMDGMEAVDAADVVTGVVARVAG